jgi:hypothetical protein
MANILCCIGGGEKSGAAVVDGSGEVRIRRLEVAFGRLFAFYQFLKRFDKRDAVA